MDSQRTADYIWGFEELIMMYEMLKSGVMSVSFVERYLQPYIKEFMIRWNEQLPRKKGNNWSILKFHSLMHLPEMLIAMGNAMVTNTDTGESGHKETKACGQNTQRVSKKFDNQTGVQLADLQPVRRAAIKLGMEDISDDDAGNGKDGVFCSSFLFDQEGIKKTTAY